MEYFPLKYLFAALLLSGNAVCQEESTDAKRNNVPALSQETIVMIIIILGSLIGGLLLILLILICCCCCRGGDETEKSSPPIGPYSMQDRKLAQSAQMFHFQHQKQQMMALEKQKEGKKSHASDTDSENSRDDGNIYECPGLAQTCETEIHNPMFREDDDGAASNSQRRAVSRGNGMGASSYTSDDVSVTEQHT